MEERFKELTDYLDRMGVEYTIDTNPSPEKIKRIKKQIEENLN